jgi:alpha-1,3-mannosyltransferase
MRHEREHQAPRMRVTHVVRQFSPSVGGIEEVVLNLARHQRETHGIDARVITLDSVFADRGRRLPHQAVVSGVPVERVRWWGSRRYPIAPGVFRHVLQADIVHVHAIDFFADFLALTRVLHRRPMVVTTHGGIFHTGRQARLKRLWFATITRLALKAFKAVIACSDNDAALFARLRPPHLVTIENGADVAKLRTVGGPPPLPGRILCIGRFASHKRIGALFPLLAALRRRSPEWTLVVAGVEWGETAADLARQAEKAGVADAVRIIVGASDKALATEAAEATWFGCASAFEGFGVAAVEAAAAGLIPILSRIPTFERLASELPVAVLFDPGAPDQAALDILAQDAACRDRAEPVREALRQAAERYDWAHAAAQHAALYEAILHSTAAAGATRGPQPHPAHHSA